MSQTFKKLKELFLKNIEEEKKQLEEINSDIEKILELSNKLDNAYAKKIQSAFKEYKTKKQEKLVENFSKRLASTTISQAYRNKLKLVILNKLIADQLCSIKGKQDSYRNNIKNLLSENETPERLSNMYFYFCKFGSKKLGSINNKSKIEDKIIIREIVGCVFINTSFASTNLSRIEFKHNKFINVTGSKYNKLLARNTSYKTIKEKYNINNDKIDFKKTDFTFSSFEECEFLNIELKETYFATDNNKPTFYKCKFNDCNIELPLYFINETYNINIKYPVINNVEVDKNSGEFIRNITYFDEQSNLVFDNNTFNNTTFINKNDDKIISKYLFKNCIFNKVLFIKCRFGKCNFIKCTFNGCNFEESELKNCHLKESNFYNTIFNNILIGYSGPNQISNCQIIDCTFKSGIFHNYLSPIATTIIDSTTIINNCKFIQTLLLGFKFNNSSLYGERKESNKMLDLRKNDFICCDMLGTNFDNCNLEGSKFAARTTCISYFNWFGSIYKFYSTKPKFGENKTIEFKNLCQNDINFNKFIDEFKGDKGTIKITRLPYPDYLQMRYNEYIALNIDINNLREVTTKIKPHDYFEVPNHGFCQIIPATSMFNSNIKNCNFQSLDGFQSFDFTQLMKTKIDGKNYSDLTATNFTHVRLENANFNGCNLIGTVFQVADIKGADFRNTIVNNNTDFENTMNVELVPHQIEEYDGNGVLVRRYVEGSKNRDTTRELEFSALQQQANETHARSQHLIDSRIKFESLLKNMEIPEDTQILTNMKDFLIKQNIPLDVIDHIIIPNSQEKIIDFLSKLVVIYNKILDSERNLPEEDKNYIKNNFAEAISNYVAHRLNYTRKEKTNLFNDFKSLISEEFLNILLSFKRDSNGNKWCWLQLVTLSLKFLFTNTEMYIFMFMQYYFNEVFNAHGQGSKSCTLGMVERLVLTHSQASEGYLMTLKMDSNELKNLSSTINSIIKYNPANPSVNDNKINEEFIKNFNNPDDVQVYHHKYIYNKLINILKPNSDLPENKEEDLGFDFDYNISTTMRDKCSIYIKDIIDSGEISTIDQICQVYVKTMQTLIIHNNGVSQDKIIFYLKEAKPKLRDLFVKKLDAIKEHLETREVEFLKMDIVIRYGEEFTLDDLKDYFTLEGGLKMVDKNEKFKKKEKFEEKFEENFEKNIIQKIKDLNIEKFKKFFEDNYEIYSHNYNKEDLLKATTKKYSRKYSKNYSKHSRKYSKNYSENNTNVICIPKYQAISYYYEVTIDKVANIQKSFFLNIYTKEDIKDIDYVSYSYCKDLFKNENKKIYICMNITDKPYKNLIKKDYEKIKENYKEKIKNYKQNIVIKIDKHGNNNLMKKIKEIVTQKLTRRRSQRPTQIKSQKLTQRISQRLTGRRSQRPTGRISQRLRRRSQSNDLRREYTAKSPL